MGGPALSLSKSLAEFRGRSREISVNHFRRRRVRRRKYFSRSGVSNCPPLADNRGAERSASPFVEEGFAFFDKLKAAQESGDKEKLSLYAGLLYDQALLVEGMLPDDPVAFASHVCELM